MYGSTCSTSFSTHDSVSGSGMVISFSSIHASFDTVASGVTSFPLPSMACSTPAMELSDRDAEEAELAKFRRTRLNAKEWWYDRTEEKLARVVEKDFDFAYLKFHNGAEIDE